MARQILFFMCLSLFPLCAKAQNLEVTTPEPVEQAVVSQDAALQVLCTTTAKLYALASKYAPQVEEQNKYRERQERVTIEIEQARKIDPAGEKPRQAAPNEDYHAAVFTKEPTVCAELNRALEQFILTNEGAIQTAVKKLVERAASMNENEKQLFASKLAECTNSARHPTMATGQKVLYACIYRTKNIRNVPLSYSVEKTMRRLFGMQESLLDAWLGDVD